VKPLGFSVDDKHLKRAGLDYWHEAEILYYDNFAELKNKFPSVNFWFIETSGEKNYAEVNFSDGDFLVFGQETKGMPQELLKENFQNCLRIPMKKNTRSLNLSNSVALILYEALRKIGFIDLK
jgi:tRNA (cytidine/uridine-2'-O-)-methyltransferase